MATLADSARQPQIALRFRLTIFVSSFLLFLVQPMIARLALPRFGGAPAVWNSAMLVYQSLLLLGYAYAHQISLLPVRRQITIHALLFIVAALTLPIGLIATTLPSSLNPVVSVPLLLALSVGPLFFVISAQAPLLQRWFGFSGGTEPYALYAASNLGSFGGLLCYPLIVEPLIPLVDQRLLWSGSYLSLGILMLWCAYAAVGQPSQEPQTILQQSAKSFRPRLILLAAIPSGLILSTTLYLTTDIVAMPLLWVVPLAAYLLSFVVAFAEKRSLARLINAICPLTMIISAMGAAIFTSMGAAMLVFIIIMNLFCVSVVLHSRLYELRPEPEQLTAFYLALSVGGVLGGIFCALIAPLLFNWTFEHWILLAAAAFAAEFRSPFYKIANLWSGDVNANRFTIGLLGLIIALALFGLISASSVASLILVGISIVAIGNRLLFGAAIVGLILCAGGWDRLRQSFTPGQLTRSYFGVYSVASDAKIRTLTHGTTIHGVQNLGSQERERMATAYYAPLSGVGLAMTHIRARRVAVVGLGAGTLACYAKPGQSWTFYEIDPKVQRIAQDRFTFLSRCLPGARVVLGDARLTLIQAAPASADVLVIDAFSSDSIPAHLLTAEAFDLYRRRLSPTGILLIHISNRFLDIEPVVSGAAANGGWYTAAREFTPTEAERQENQTHSLWIALSPDEPALQDLVRASGAEWRPLRQRQILWTDEHASLLPIVRWGL